MIEATNAMAGERQHQVLGLPVDSVTPDQAATMCEAFCTENTGASPTDSRGPHLVITLNVEMTMGARKDPYLRESILSASLIIPDSVGIQKAAGLPQRVPGIELLEELARRAGERGGSFYLLGAAPGVAEEAATILTGCYPGLRIAGARDGYFKPEEESAVLADIAEARPDYLFVALGAGRQEKWIHRHSDRLAASVAMGVGGSFDVISGRAKRAPEIFRRLNLEWAYRITTQPARIGRAVPPLLRFTWAILFSRDRRSA